MKLQAFVLMLDVTTVEVLFDFVAAGFIMDNKDLSDRFWRCVWGCT